MKRSHCCLRMFLAAMGALMLPLIWAASANACDPVLYSPVGDWNLPSRSPSGPGLLLMGGGRDVDSAFVWMHAILAGKAPERSGKVVVLRASGDNAYDSYIYSLAPFLSVRTILISPCVAAVDLQHAAEIVSQADAVFFAGGDQANYVRWKNTALSQAVTAVYSRHGVVGGTSAGLAILGEIAFDAVAADAVDKNVYSADAVRDPFESIISFTTDFFRFEPLRATVTDTHFVKRDRFGRLAAFMARVLHDEKISIKTVYGVGIDERTSLAVDRLGIATLLKGNSAGAAYILRGDRPRRFTPGSALDYAVSVVKLQDNGEHYDLLKHIGTQKPYTVHVDGTKVPPYSRDPY